MFEARLIDGSILKKILEASRELLSEAAWECSESGISLQAMDGSHVSLVSLFLSAEGFDKYRCDRNLSMGINMNSMNKILKCAASDDIITIKSEDDGTSDVVTFTFESPKYMAVITMSSNAFSKMCKDLMLIGESVCISCTKGGVNFSCEGDLGSGTIKLAQHSAEDDEEGDNLVIEIQEPVKLTFALKYLNHFSRASTLSKTVKLSLSKDVPLAVEFTIPSLGYIRYYLAPKIEEDADSE